MLLPLPDEKLLAPKQNRPAYEPLPQLPPTMSTRQPELEYT